MQQLLDYYAQFMALSKESPVIGGMVGLWIAGCITWACRSLPRKLWAMLVNQFTVTLTMTNAGSGGNLAHFVSFQKWAAKLKGGKFSRRYAISTNEYVVTGPPDISMGFGLHFFVYKGRLFWYKKSKLDSSGSESEKYEITLHGMTRNRDIIPAMVQDFHYRENREGTGIIEFERYNWADRFMVPQRSLDTVILNRELKAKIMHTITDFTESEAWYRHRSLAYKLTMILEGPPGTGKTSLVRAIAGWLTRDIHTIKIGQLTDDNIMKAIRGVKKGSILLLEDFDTNTAVKRRAGVHTDFQIKLTNTGRIYAAHREFGRYVLSADPEPHLIEFGDNTRDRLLDADASDAMRHALLDHTQGKKPVADEGTGALSLSALLNALDGVLPLDDVIVIMTTNAIDDIDPALLRKGRVDHIFHVPYLEDAEVKQYIATMCPEYIVPSGKRFKDMPGCDLQALYLENKHDPAAFVDSIPYFGVVEESAHVSYLKTQTH